MDASKLRNIGYDLTVNEELEINHLLKGLHTVITNGEHSETPSIINNLKELYEESSYMRYTPSNVKIVEFITNDTFFGIPGYVRLTNILSQNSLNINEVLKELKEYTDKRVKFTDELLELYNLLGSFNINNHYNSSYIFELGLLMSKDYSKNKIVNITKELNHWDKIIRTFTEVSGNTPEDTEISFINNGSFEFFTNIDPAVALMVAHTVERVIAVYKRILEIKETREKLKSLGVPLQVEHKNAEKDIASEEINKIASDLFKEFTIREIEAGRLNELKVAVRGHITYIAKSLNDGLIIEINPPELTAPVPPVEDASDEDKTNNKKEFNKYKKMLEKIDIVQKSMQVIKDIHVLGSGIVKYFLEDENDNLNH